MMTNPGAAASFLDHLFSNNVSISPDIPPWARDVLRSGCIFNNGHLFVDLQLQVKIDTKTNTEAAGALAKPRLSLLPTERVGWERNTSGRGDKEAEEQRKSRQRTKHRACVSQCWKNDLSLNSVSICSRYRRLHGCITVSDTRSPSFIDDASFTQWTCHGCCWWFLKKTDIPSYTFVTPWTCTKPQSGNLFSLQA